MEGPVQALIDVAIREELLNAMVYLFVLDVRPVRHIELFVNCKPPFVSIVPDTADISLSAQVLPVERVALGIPVEELLGLDGLRVLISADHTLAEATDRVGH